MRNLVVAIGREFGSGGKEIGQKLADRLNIKCYDSELLSIAAKNSGFCEEILQKNDEKPTNSFLYSLVMDTYSMSGYTSAPFVDMPLNHKVFLAQFEAIKKLASEEPCVIVGRCADEILAYNPNLVSVFITGDRESKIARVMDREGLDRKQAINKMKRMDKIRKTYHNFYCRNKWGDSRGYDICINTGKTDFDTAKNMVVECVDKLKERSE